MIFRSNLDLSKAEKWPEYLSHRPIVGDYVCSGHIWKTAAGPRQLRLVVVSITWKFLIGCWEMEVELHLPLNGPWETVSQFIDWYDFVQGKISLETYQRRSDANDRFR